MATIRILNPFLSLLRGSRKMATLNITRSPRPNNSKDSRNCRGRHCRDHALRHDSMRLHASYHMVSFGDVIVKR